MQDQYIGQAGTFIIDPDTGARIPLEQYLAGQAATAPGTPVITNALGNGTATVTVTASVDAIDVIGYAAFLDGAVNEAGRSNTTVISLSGIPVGAHNISVRSVDMRGNYSAASSAGFSIPKTYEAIALRTTLAELTGNGVERVGKVIYVDGVAVGGVSDAAKLTGILPVAALPTLTKAMVSLSNVDTHGSPILLATSMNCNASP